MEQKISPSLHKKKVKLNYVQGTADNPSNLYMQIQKAQVSLHKSSDSSQASKVFFFARGSDSRKKTVLRSQERLVYLGLDNITHIQKTAHTI